MKEIKDKKISLEKKKKRFDGVIWMQLIFFFFAGENLWKVNFAFLFLIRLERLCAGHATLSFRPTRNGLD